MVPFLSFIVLLHCSSWHTVLTYGKAWVCLCTWDWRGAHRKSATMDDTAPIPGSEQRRPLSPAWASPAPTCGVPGPGLSPLPLAMAMLGLGLFLEAAPIHCWGDERCPAPQPQSYPLLSCIWSYRLFSSQLVLPRGQVLPRCLTKWLGSAAASAARAWGRVRCLTIRTTATQGSCEPWHGAARRPL